MDVITKTIFQLFLNLIIQILEFRYPKICIEKLFVLAMEDTG